MVKKVAGGDDSSSVSAPQNSFQAALDPAKRFAQDSFRLVKRCTKPDAKEFKKIALATTVGFLVMGFLGFFVKLVHIPSQWRTPAQWLSLACRCGAHAAGMRRRPDTARIRTTCSYVHARVLILVVMCLFVLSVVQSTTSSLASKHGGVPRGSI
jgi:protein transport protein SEC61 subunit gamma-like protein